jgi:hypothetical protein
VAEAAGVAATADGKHLIVKLGPREHTSREIRVITNVFTLIAERERELGAGGMATVYLAEDVRHRRKVAVKVLRPELAASMKGIMVERGGQLYFTLGENESDLWVVELGSTW